MLVQIINHTLLLVVTKGLMKLHIFDEGVTTFSDSFYFII